MIERAYRTSWYETVCRLGRLTYSCLYGRGTGLQNIFDGGAQLVLDHPFIPLLGRLLITYIFATSGIAKIFSWSDNVAYMSTRHLPMIPVLLAFAALIELAGSASLVTGYQARIAAFVMFWYLTAVTILFHNYWAATSMVAAMQETHFRKNLAVMGGLLMLAHCGPGKWALGAHGSNAALPLRD